MKPDVRRITFSTATPNDQGGVIPSNVIDLSRFVKNPVVLKEHIWSDDPIGLWTDVKNEGGVWSGIPVFHGLTEESRTTKDLYEGGWIRGASIGGDCVWMEDAAGRPKLDKDGNWIAKIFYLYEVSIVTLPSNQDAVQEDPVKLAAKIYDKKDLDNISRNIVTLSSKFNKTSMEPVINEAEATKLAEEKKKLENAEPKKPLTKVQLAAKALEEAQAEELAEKEKGDGHIKLSASSLPGFMKEIITSVASAVSKFAAPAPKDTPETKAPSIEDVKVAQPTPIGLKAGEKGAKEKGEFEKAKESASAKMEAAAKAKEKAEKEDATKEDKEAYASAVKECDAAMKECEACEQKYKAAMDDDGEGEDGEEMKAKKEKEKAEKTKNSSQKNMKPEIKTMEQLKAEQVKLAAKPQARVITKGGKTFTQLCADKEEGQRILTRVQCRDAAEKNIEDYAVVLGAIMEDPKYGVIAEKTRLMANVSHGQMEAYQRNPNTRNGSGMSLREVQAGLSAGTVEVLGRDNVLRQRTTLTSTDAALASPALNTIEWLSLAIFTLFPSTSWKNEIPIFPAEITGKNTGIIWANIAAAPTIYRGTQPSNPANYSTSDTAVALSLTPYWLQPMLWTPLTMHQLRYDQMGTQWAQAFALWGAVMDDNLIYNLASTVPAGSIVGSSGISGYATTPQQLAVGPNGPNNFYYNPNYTGNVLAPVLNDIITIEQIYANQNFALDNQKAVLVIDPIMEAAISRDPETKSLLTRFINEGGAEILKYKHTLLNQRSRVAIYDPASGQVKDPYGTIPATAISAGLGFVPSQAAIGLGMLDVFMVQSPGSYGYVMSADIRIGAVPLRANFNGMSLYTYGLAAGGI